MVPIKLFMIKKRTNTMYFSMAVLVHSYLMVTVICVVMYTVYKIKFYTFNLEGHWNVQVFLFPPIPFPVFLASMLQKISVVRSSDLDIYSCTVCITIIHLIVLNDTYVCHQSAVLWRMCAYKLFFKWEVWYIILLWKRKVLNWS